MGTEPNICLIAPRAVTVTAEPVACAHCGLPVPAGLIEPSSQCQFCCQGCKTVYELIHGSGLEQFYRLREQKPGAAPTRATSRSYGSFDTPAFMERYCRSITGGLFKAEFYLQGIHCAACVWLIEKLPKVIPGVVEARVDFRRSTISLTWEPQQVALSQVAETLDHLGYPPHPAKDARPRELRRAEDRRFYIRLAVAGAIAGNVMTLAFAFYGETSDAMEATHAMLLRWVGMGLGLLSLGWPGSVFFRNAWAALRTRTAHLDIPIALGLLVGGIAGTVNTVLGRGQVYFDSLTMLVFLLLVARWLQFRQQRWTADAVEFLYSLTPATARKIEGDDIREVPAETLATSDLVEVRTGETIPADGTVASGETTVDVSWLTGESQPAVVRVGERVYAGTVNISTPMRFLVEAAGADTRAARLIRLVEEGTQTRPPIVRFADRVAGWFTLIVIALAIATLGAWLYIDPLRAPDAASALLIVSCPCALGLATPLAFTAAIGRAAKRGILIKGGEVIEVLARCGRLFIDKTGTVTEGRFSLARWHGDPSVQPLVAAIEQHSSHPVAVALVRALNPVLTAEAQRATSLDLPEVQIERAEPRGILGIAGERRIIVGTPPFVRSLANTTPDSLIAAEQDVVRDGLTPVLVGIDDRVVAVAGLGDLVREDSAVAVGTFRDLGWHVTLLSGDHPDVTSIVGRRVGLPENDCQGGFVPEAKLNEIRRALGNGAVVMVGDGVNDVAALSAATVGIAVHGGAEASLAAADVYLTRPGLAPIVQLLRASRATISNIRLSFAVSLVYNLVSVTLAATGVITPLIAAVLMPASSLTSAVIVLGRKTFGDEPCR